MKKSKLSITLVTSFIAAMALTACNEVTKSDKAIVTFTPYDGSEAIEIITNDVYKQYRGTSSGISMFYDKILEVLTKKDDNNKLGGIVEADETFFEESQKRSRRVCFERMVNL